MQPNRIRKGDRTRKRILDSAGKLLLTRDFSELTMAEIGKPAKIAPATIYEHFKDKDELLLESIRHMIGGARQEIDARVKDSDPAEKRLRAILRANLETSIEMMAPLMSLFYFAAIKPSVRELEKEFQKSAVSRIEVLVIHGNREGTWKIARTAVVARSIHSLLIGEMIKSHYDPDEIGFEARFKALWNAVGGLLRSET
jgi:AcrR family transcriptional regulator